MGIVISPDSELGKELVKFEQHQTRFVGEGQTPGNPYVYRPYPAMLYKVQMLNGQARCLEPPPSTYEYADVQSFERAVLRVDQFNRSCQRTVETEREHTRARSQGWRDTPTEALAHHEALEQEMGQAAAEAAHAAQRMSTKAKAELKEAETTTHRHVTDVVAAPKNKRGRKARAVEVRETGDAE